MPAITASTPYLDARNLSVRQGTTHIAGVGLSSTIAASASRIELTGLRLDALGGTLTGNSSIENLDRFHFAGDLRRIDIDQLSRTLLAKPLGYDGIVSGPVRAEGSLKNPAALVARADLASRPAVAAFP